MKTVCVICGKSIIGYGNNPWPVLDDGRCCDECNNLVIRERLKNLINMHNEERDYETD